MILTGGWILAQSESSAAITPSVVIAIVAVCISVFSLASTVWIGRRSARAAEAAVKVARRQTELQSASAEASIVESRRATEVAREQTDLQRAIAVDSQKPRVWASFRRDPRGGDGLMLYAGNSGRSVARNVRIGMDVKNEPGQGLSIEAASIYSRRYMLLSLVPGETHEWVSGFSFSQHVKDATPTHHLFVQWEDQAGYPDGDSYDFRLSDVLSDSLTGSGSLAELTDAVKDLKGRDAL